MKRFYFKYQLILLIISLIYSSCNNEIKDEMETEETIVWELREPELDENGNYIYDVGREVVVDLNDEFSLRVGEKSVEYKLFQMLNDDSFQINSNEEFGWITLDRVHWIDNELYESSLDQFENLVQILNSFPQSIIKIGGFTDDDSRRNEFEKKVKKVYEELVKMGIDSNRLSYQVYGKKNLVCESNDTDLCRAQNRRVDIRLIDK